MKEGRLEKRDNKDRGFYRPPAATKVVGRRKLLALVVHYHQAHANLQSDLN